MRFTAQNTLNVSSRHPNDPKLNDPNNPNNPDNPNNPNVRYTLVNAAFIMPLENFLWAPVAPYLAVVTAVVLAALTQMPPIAALIMPLENFLWAPALRIWPS